MLNAKKLLLATSIALASSASFAMQAMDDDSLAETTGQDGVTVSINTSALTFNMNIYDNDAFGALANVGVLTMNGIGLNTGGGAIVFGIDAGSAAAGANPILNIAVTIPTGTIINTGSIGVAGTATAKNVGAGTGADGVFATPVNNSVILNNMTVTLGATTLNLQLGNNGVATGGQGSLAVLNTTITNGITVANFSLNDAGGGGSLGIVSTRIDDAGASNDLTVNATARITAGGLVIGMTQIGDATNGLDLRMTDLSLGSGATNILGDVSIVGLNLNGTTVTITGR